MNGSRGELLIFVDHEPGPKNLFLTINHKIYYSQNTKRKEAQTFRKIVNGMSNIVQTQGSVKFPQWIEYCITNVIRSHS